MKGKAERSHFLGDACAAVAVFVAKSDVTRDDSQRQFLAQDSVAMLEQRCNHSKQYRNNVAKNRPV